MSSQLIGVTLIFFGNDKNSTHMNGILEHSFDVVIGSLRELKVKF